MKIGVVTKWDSSDNYGQLLQCFALQNLLRSWGYDAFLIRYVPDKKRKLSLLQLVKKYFKHPGNFLCYLPFDTNATKFVREEARLKRSNDEKNLQRRFDQFRGEHLVMTPLIYHSYDELYANPPYADIYIAGSDQIWGYPYSFDGILGFFLQFGNSDTRRIAYAASIGRNLTDDELPQFKKNIETFDFVSVREKSALSLCDSLGIKAQVCLDPTLLLSATIYKELAKKPAGQEEYAFFYVLNVRTSEDFYWKQIKEYLEGRKLEMMSVTGSGYYEARELIDGNKSLLATIPEWLGYIMNAQCVFTTSFHGTVFSILMHRPFLTIRLGGKHCQANSRMENLLEALGISDRILNPEVSIQQQMDASIDWAEVDKRLSELKTTSISFLRKCFDASCNNIEK